MSGHAERLPTVAQIREIRDAARVFLDAMHNPFKSGVDLMLGLSPLFKQVYLDEFGRLADSLRPIRPLIDEFEGWKPPVVLAVRTLLEVLDTVKEGWGWAPLDIPEPERSAETLRLDHQYFREVELPRMEAAFAWYAGMKKEAFLKPEDRGRHLDVRFWAEEAEGAFDIPTMSPEEGKAKFLALPSRPLKPYLGKRTPPKDVLGVNEIAGLWPGFRMAIDQLDAELQDIDGALVTSSEPGPSDQDRQAKRHLQLLDAAVVLDGVTIKVDSNPHFKAYKMLVEADGGFVTGKQAFPGSRADRREGWRGLPAALLETTFTRRGCGRALKAEYCKAE